MKTAEIPTAEDVLMKHYDDNYRSSYKEGIPKQCYVEAAIIFAKLHVQTALSMVIEKAQVLSGPPDCIDSESILESYSLENIK